MSSCNSKSGCSTCSTSGSCEPNEKQKHEEALVKEKLGQIKKKVMIMSGKGGVGKSTVTANLAATLAKSGKKVGIIDADIHGPNMAKMFGVEDAKLIGDEAGIFPIEPMENLKIVTVAFILPGKDDPVIWRASLKHSLIKQFVGEVIWGELDVLLIDLPPGTGDEPLSVAHIIGNVDASVVVTTPQDVATLDSRKSVTFSKKLNIPVLGIVENMSGFCCPNCDHQIDLFKRGGGRKAAEDLDVPFLGGIPIDPSVVEQGDAGTPYVLAKPESAGAKIFSEIAEKIVG